MAGYKLATYQSAEGPRAGAVVGDLVYDVAALTGQAKYVSVLDVLNDWDKAHALIDPIKARIRVWLRLFAPGRAGRTVKLLRRIRRRMSLPA